MSHSTGGLDLTLPLTTHEPVYLQSHIFFYLYQILCNCKFSSSNDNSHWRLFLDTLELESPTSKTHSKILIDNPGSLLPVHSRLHRVTELLVTQELPEPAGVLFVFLCVRCRHRKCSHLPGARFPVHRGWGAVFRSAGSTSSGPWEHVFRSVGGMFPVRREHVFRSAGSTSSGTWGARLPVLRGQVFQSARGMSSGAR